MNQYKKPQQEAPHAGWRADAGVANELFLDDRFGGLQRNHHRAGKQSAHQSMYYPDRAQQIFHRDRLRAAHTVR
jgi:hypothetical protein